MGRHVTLQDRGHHRLRDRGRDRKAHMAKLGARQPFDGGNGAVKMRQLAAGLDMHQFAQGCQA